MKLPHKTLEKNLFKSGYRYVYAVDEVGVGCLAGPVVVCAVLFDRKFYQRSHKKLRGLRDSKLLQTKQREKFAMELLKIKNLRFKIGYCFPKTIDRINIYQAARLAMRRAVKRLINKLSMTDYALKKQSVIRNTKLINKAIVLIDGKNKIKKLNLEQLPIVKGDRKIFAIACASIIAKVYRDRMMTRYAKHYPGYGFEKHKGYGTKYHRAQLVSLGLSKIHRRSFNLEY